MDIKEGSVIVELDPTDFNKTHDTVKFKSPLGLVLYNMRKEAGLTQGELADKVGVSKSCVGACETGARNPTLFTIEMIARGLGMKTTIVFTPIDEK